MGAHAAGKINDDQLEALEAAACPGPGACGGQFTANTMAMAGEFLGISPMMISGVPAMSPEKAEACRAAGRMVMDLARRGVKPSEILTRKSIENAIAAVAASGGSTNAVLHLIAIAHEPNIPIYDGRLRPHLRAHALHLRPLPRRQVRSQGLPGRRRFARARSAARCNAISYTMAPPSPARSLHEEAALAVETPGQHVIHTWDKPLKATGGLVILRGNLAPEGCVIKVAGHERLLHTGTARVFENEEDCHRAVEAGKINPGDVLVIRYEGPKGGPGMREMLAVTAAVKGIPALSDTVALLNRRPLQRSHPRPHGRACRA